MIPLSVGAKMRRYLSLLLRSYACLACSMAARCVMAHSSFVGVSQLEVIAAEGQNSLIKRIWVMLPTFALRELVVAMYCNVSAASMPGTIAV